MTTDRTPSPRRQTPQRRRFGYDRQGRKMRFSPVKALKFFTPIVFIIVLGVVMCVPTSRDEHDGTVITPDTPPVARVLGGKLKNVIELENTDTVTYHKMHLEEMPPVTGRLRVNYFGDMRKAFNDSNYIHLAEAAEYGLQPLTDTRSHWQLTAPIVKITSCADYYVDSLVYSRPYLVPQAARVLREIGSRFRDSIQARGGGDYRFKVTSVLRTPDSVRRLRRRNRNAIDSSVHQYGTTFDISYANFIATAGTPGRSVDDLKGILGEVLREMRREGKLWVKFERHQPCFHITARHEPYKPLDQ